MSDDPRQNHRAEPPHPPADRLESWKDIAQYLRRDVRTVQRWEQTDGLPVHRHQRARRPIPYAYKAELDAWWTNHSASSSPAVNPLPLHQTRRWRARSLLGVTAVVAMVAISGYWYLRSRAAHGSNGRLSATQVAVAPAASLRNETSIAVLPFLDLTDGMKEEEFADGMTEEVIDRLNKVPGLRVPAPTSSFYFKNKRLPVDEIARTLNVSYLLDGSVRKSGNRLRVAARLIRGANANVIWSETYDRAWDDALTVQDEIAGAVARALTSSIEARPAA